MNRTNRNILHVDDDPQFTRLVERALSGHGYQVKALHDPLLVLDELACQSHRAVLLDIDMPQMSGLEVLRQIKRFDGGVQVIMLTGIVGVGNMLQSLRWGAEACFFKPLTDYQPLLQALELTFRKLDRWWEALAELSQHRRAESTPTA